MNYLFKLRLLNESLIGGVYIKKGYNFVPHTHFHYGLTYIVDDIAVMNYNQAMAICNYCWSIGKIVVIPEVIEDENAK